jgi:hypothetical protein
MKDRFSFKLPLLEKEFSDFSMFKNIVKFLKDNPGKRYLFSADVLFNGKELEIEQIHFHEMDKEIRGPR